ncbi:MAG TPA: hypothetical protein PKL08_11940 [Thermoanaerobaculaceae bacterium]|nr:hypothetical protein [Thermoanaerobaculaceae bacterium]
MKILKNRPTEYVRLAGGREVVLITDRERVVTELQAPEPGLAESLDDVVLASMVRKGLLSPALAASPEPPPRHPVAPLHGLLAELDADRGDG